MKNSGFTLIELLVVVAIIGILAAIAIPQFQAYRQRGYDTAAISQGRNAMTSLEAAFSEGTFHCEFTYYPDGSAPVYGGGSNTVSACLPGFTREPQIMTSVYSYGASATTSNNIVTCHRMGSGQGASHNMFLFSSRLGEMQRITSSFNDSIWPNSAASSNLNNGCDVS